MGTRCISIPCTKVRPCAVCGKTDYCWVGDYGSEGYVHFCSQVKSPEVYASGVKFILQKITSNNYAAYVTEEQKQAEIERWKEEQRRSNPNWVERKSSGKRKFRPVNAPLPVVKERVVMDEVKPLPHKTLDYVYRFMLDQLILEDEHKKALLDEWNVGIEKELGEKILSIWPIRSLPMNDLARKTSKTPLKNITREELINRLIKRFKGLLGVPGFYRDEKGKWQLSSISGIIYPQYDSQGYIYRIRIGDEHPNMDEFAKDRSGNYIYYTDAQGKEKKQIGATYSWNYSTGEWYRKENDSGRRELVYSRQNNVHRISLSPKGYPVIDGKPDGKYKNFSSRSDKTVEKEDKILIYNRYADGTRSGSNISLYCKPDDDFRYVYVTEGEKKAMVMNILLGCPVIALPGVSTYSKLFDKDQDDGRSIMDYLMSKGLKFVIIVYDADKAVNQAVLNNEEGAVNICKEHGIQTLIGEWKLAFGKGADDVLIQGNRFTYLQT